MPARLTPARSPPPHSPPPRSPPARSMPARSTPPRSPMSMSPGLRLTGGNAHRLGGTSTCSSPLRVDPIAPPARAAAALCTPLRPAKRLASSSPNLQLPGGDGSRPRCAPRSPTSSSATQQQVALANVSADQLHSVLAAAAHAAHAAPPPPSPRLPETPTQVGIEQAHEMEVQATEVASGTGSDSDGTQPPPPASPPVVRYGSSGAPLRSILPELSPSLLALIPPRRRPLVNRSGPTPQHLSRELMMRAAVATKPGPTSRRYYTSDGETRRDGGSDGDGGSGGGSGSGNGNGGSRGGSSGAGGGRSPLCLDPRACLRAHSIGCPCALGRASSTLALLWIA